MRRNTILLALLLAALAGYYYFFELGKSDTKANEKLINLKPEDATGVALDYQGRAIVLRKDPQTNKWRLAAPLQAPADDAAVDGLLATLSSVAIKRTLEKLPSETVLKNYGLEPPAVTVSVTLKSGLTLPSLTVGTKTALGDSTYAQRSADPAVYLVDGSLGDALAREPEELRDKSVLPLPQEPIARLEIAADGKPIVLTKDEKEQWKIEAPVSAPANAQAVNRYIFDLARLQARSFIDNPPDARKYGMDKPALKVTLGGAGGKTLASVEAGRSGNAWFARREGDTTIFAIDENSYKTLLKQPEDFKAEEKKPEEKKAEEKKEEKKAEKKAK